MLNRRKLGMMAAGVLSMAVAQAASAYTISNGSIVTPIAPYTNSVTFNYANAAGYAIGTYVGPTNLILPWRYSAATGTSIAIGLFPADDVDYEAFSATSGRNFINSTSTSASSQISSAGDFIGLAARGYSSTGTGFVALGQDAWLYKNGSTTSTVPGILKPTLVGQTASLTTDPNGLSVTSNYFYTISGGVADTHTFRSNAAIAVNASQTVIGTSNRYTGLSGVTTQLGADAWVNTGSGPALLGLGVSTTNTGTSGVGFYYFTQSGLVSRTSGFASNTSSSVPGLVSLDNNGVVVGTTTRYQTNTANTTAGADGWMYNYAASGATVQIGLVGTSPTAPVTVSDVTGTTPTTISSLTYEFNNGSYTQRSTAIVGLNNGQVIGTTAMYNGTVNPVGNQAWIYTPGTSPGTATALGTTAGVGTYSRIGLTGSVALPGSPLNPAAQSISNMGYVNSTGTSTTTVAAFSNTGKAAGQQSRSLNSGTGGYGTDAWYYNGSTTLAISPWTSAATNPGFNVQYVYGAITSPTIPTSGGNPIISLSVVTAANPSGTTATATVTTMNPSGNLVGGILTTYNATTSINANGAAFVYDAVTNMEYILITPSATLTKTTNSFITIKSISDSGVVVGTWNDYGGGASVIASYLYEWTIAGGFTTIDQITATTSGTVQPLNTLLSGQPGWSGLFNSTPNANASLYLGANDVLYGPGSTTGSPVTVTNGVWAMTTPEPSSLALLGLGGLFLARRGRRSVR